MIIQQHGMTIKLNN